MKDLNSRISGFYNKETEERQQILKERLNLTDGQLEKLQTDSAGLPLDVADRMIENVVGRFQLPFGIATNFTVNGQDYLIPMAVEEPSVVAAASNMARIARESGGFQTSYTGSIMIAQMHILDLNDTNEAQQKIQDAKQTLLDQANTFDKTLTSLGGGAIDIELRTLQLRNGEEVLALHLLVDVLDAMGANTVNTMTEKLTPEIEQLTGGKVLLRILSNLASYRLAKATVSIPVEHLATEGFSGEEVAKRMVLANEIAWADPYRAATHNKGIMNGIDPVVLATGNDWRAIEAGAHAYAARDGQYRALTEWQLEDGQLKGVLELPMAVGIVGGATKTHPTAQLALEIMGIQSSSDLAQLIAAVGLSQNMGAIKALATEGIQRGHMALHARNIAVQAGASNEQIDWLTKQMVSEKNVHIDRAKELLQQVKN
ncbi:hydroxymethylglutaryl-CoA reductase, degradative [Planomicrobium sp. YIM 101495]|uniref:hydroxymethylglutaryl-CoA reductase, degradative n=1 Tax=Planomicrobium sp. YIM 101495 TaxID=2665160 RepID=UPI0012B875C2|nr:hydroxymethylglutaryl-CoA reductase, degradative [Planomicrobium sp. YIM 101495]MTD30685.1 hydroxymethylglutaryl-CoA reductase, degradative [Planomicrobium sp. YIM 101495]